MPKFETEKFESLFAMEESVLSFWQEKDIFAKSTEKNPADQIFSFYDGPPFITGTPHYATLLPSIAKDIIPRYQTMKGKRVRRIWGWDVHGLPAENQVEKELGLKGKKDIEKLGIDKFIAACREYVQEGSEAWRWYINHIGRWVDLDKAYRTDQLEYMETVIWAFKQLYDAGLIYKGRRVSLFCTRCSTPLSKFEITMDEGNYRDVDDPAVTVAFPIIDRPDTFFLAWTTTPWTLPANLALAVDPQAEYVLTTNGKKRYILAHQALERFDQFDLEIVKTFKGSELVGWKYQPLYTFFPTKKTDYQIYPAKFVNMEEGTGVVHIAPGFGEDDTALGLDNNLSLLLTVDEEGKFVESVKPWAGQYIKAADPLIMEDLTKRGLLFNQSVIRHSYPHCYRCGKPLIYKSQVSWYMAIDKLKSALIANNKKINWHPQHFGKGRFVHNIETAPDWSLSRTRYWGTPIPVWQTDDGEEVVVGSIKELEKLSGQKITDLHRPNIDDVVITTPSGKKARRVKEVLDCWFESGSMPYAQDHFPFVNQEEFEAHFPADFIIEYTGQLRGWFYYLHVLAQALKQSFAFKNVSVTGVLMGTDGRKMSKSYGNYPDPRAVIEKYGAEALRLYFMSSKLMDGEDAIINEQEIVENYRLLNIFHNSWRYFLTYASIHDWKTARTEESQHILDRWISFRLEEFIAKYAEGLDDYDFSSSTQAIRPFIEDLSTWYIRRSRDRFVAGDEAAMQTLYHVLLKFALSVAPTLPFSSEVVFRSLTDEIESVHLADYPVANKVVVDENADLLDSMDIIRSIASAIHMLRAQAQLSLRQPLSRVDIVGFNSLESRPELVNLLKEEVNVQMIGFTKPNSPTIRATDLGEGTIYLETHLTDELKKEGRFRELIRSLQDARKTRGLAVGQIVDLVYKTEDAEMEGLITSKAEDIIRLCSFATLKKSDELKDAIDLKGQKTSVSFVTK